MSKADMQKEAQNIKKMLESIPFIGADWESNEVTANKLAYILLRHSQRLNKLTTALIALTAILALVTIADILVRLNLWP